ncbi:adenylate cyclase domain-containing protein [Nitratifractor sp.]
MSDTLNRLKALNDRLEKKLQAKTHSHRGGFDSEIAVAERPSSQTDVVPHFPKVPGHHDESAAEKQDSVNVPKHPSSTTKDALQERTGSTAIEEERLLHQRLVSFLELNAEEEPVRSENLRRLSELFLELDIEKKVRHIEDIFVYKAMNISGIGLREEDFGEVREGKYVQVIAITYEPDKNGKKKAKNVSLGYFGKAETLAHTRKNEVIEFVLRWRYEKAFQNLEHYKLLLDKVKPIDSLY